MEENSQARSVSRRDVLRGAAGAGAAGALAMAQIRDARAVTQWHLASPIYGSITGGWYNNALDIAGRAGSVSVYAYFRRGSAAYGYIEVTNIGASCETPLNPTHRLLDFYLRTDGGQAYASTMFPTFGIPPLDQTMRLTLRRGAYSYTTYSTTNNFALLDVVIPAGQTGNWTVEIERVTNEGDADIDLALTVGLHQ